MLDKAARLGIGQRLRYTARRDGRDAREVIVLWYAIEVDAEQCRVLGVLPSPLWAGESHLILGGWYCAGLRIGF
jgi:hypothetical protein